MVIARSPVAAARVPAVRWRPCTQDKEYLPLSRRDLTRFTRFEGAATAWNKGLETAGISLGDLQAMGLPPDGQERAV